MNGKNGLACITPVSQVIKRNKLVLRPLPGLPVVRDLVVDMKSVLQPVRQGSALPCEQGSTSRPGTFAEPGRTREAGRTV